MLTSGMVPALYADDEKEAIIGAVSNRGGFVIIECRSLILSVVIRHGPKVSLNFFRFFPRDFPMACRPYWPELS